MHRRGGTAGAGALALLAGTGVDVDDAVGATGAGETVTVALTGALDPAALLAVSVTVYVPAAAKVCDGFCIVAVVPSPKDHDHAVGASVEVSVNCTGSGACPLVVDEAYADFAREHCITLVRDHPNVIVTRSFSKGYSLAGIRLGYLVARAEIVEQLLKVKDSYNCDTLSLAAGVAALRDQDYLGQTRARILATRRRLADALGQPGSTELAGDGPVGGRRAVGDLHEKVPHAFKEGVTPRGRRHGECRPLATQVLGELPTGRLEHRVTRRGDLGAGRAGLRRVPVAGEVEPDEGLTLGDGEQVAEVRAEGGVAAAAHEP